MREDILAVPVRRVGNAPTLDHDFVAVEEPLQIRLGSTDVAITMRTPGQDDELAAGFLFTEGILTRRSDLRSIHVRPNLIEMELELGAGVASDETTRNFYLSSSCGICGKASIDSLVAEGGVSPKPDSPLVQAQLIRQLPDKLREHQRAFERTGGLHAAALFHPNGDLQAVREDVGRHNAVDKLIGRAFLDGQLPLAEFGLLLSGRISFELVQKAAMAGIPMICAIGAPSSLAVKTATRFGITLAGFIRNGHFNLYSGEGRVLLDN